MGFRLSFSPTNQSMDMEKPTIFSWEKSPDLVQIFRPWVPFCIWVMPWRPRRCAWPASRLGALQYFDHQRLVV